MAKQKRQYLTDARKTKIVKQFVKDARKDPTLTIANRAKQVKVGSSILRRWVRDPRFGGVPGLLARGDKTVLNELPTEKTGSHARAKLLVATKFECPHCGGAILGGNHVSR